MPKKKIIKKNERRTSRERRDSKKASISKKTWKKFQKNKVTQKMIKDTWKVKNPKKHFREDVIKYSKKL